MTENIIPRLSSEISFVEIDAQTPGGIERAIEIANSAYPDNLRDPAGARSWLTQSDYLWRLWLVKRQGEEVGSVMLLRPGWQPEVERGAEIDVAVLPGAAGDDIYQAIYAFAEAEATAQAAVKLLTFARPTEMELLSVLADCGYEESARERFWWLDLPAAAERLREQHAAALDRMRELGVEIKTLAADADPAKVDKLLAVNNESHQDIPSSLPRVDTSRSSFDGWLRRPGVHLDRFWLARAGEEIVGLSVLSYPEQATVSTDYTGVLRAWRGRGVGRALKLATLVQALDLGVRRVQTDNDSRNAPILHLNESLGYEVAFEVMKMTKTLRPPDPLRETGC